MILKPFKNTDNSLPSNHFKADGIEYIIVRTEGVTWQNTKFEFRDLTTYRKFNGNHKSFLEWLEKKEAIFLESVVGYK